MLEDIYDLFEADWYAINCDTVLYRNGDNRDSLLTQGQNLISVYFNQVNGEKIAAVEYPFEVPVINEETGEKLDLPLVDRFELVEQGPVIVDLKTSARKMNRLDVDRNLQLTAYSYAYWIKNGRMPDLRLDVLVKNKTPKLDRIPTSRTQKDHHIFYRIAEKVLKGIQNSIFFPNPSWMCSDCEFRQQCWMYGGCN